MMRGLEGGGLSGETFTSLFRSASGQSFLNYVADGLDVSMGQLQTLAKRGELTAVVMAQALTDSVEQINQDFSQLPLTFGENMTRAKDTVMLWLDSLNQAGQPLDIINQKVSDFVQWLEGAGGQQAFAGLTQGIIFAGNIIMPIVETVASKISWLIELTNDPGSQAFFQSLARYAQVAGNVISWVIDTAAWLAYRATLLMHKLDQYHVDAKIDTALTDNELSEYYAANRGDFALDRTLVKGAIVRLPANHPRRSQVRGLMGAGGERYQDFLELSLKNNFDVHDVTEWMDFNEFLRMLPTNNRHDYEDMLTRTGVQEMRDGDDLYLILVRSYIRRGEPTPIEQVREDIRRVILNQRRQEIVRAYEDSLRNAAIAEKKLKIKIEPEEDIS